MTKDKISIRGLDEELYREAKAQAARQGKPLYQWINEAIKEKLERTGGKK
jgi:predicted HicB family RNase H-like nuclease